MNRVCQVLQTASLQTAGSERRLNLRLPRGLYSRLRRAADAYGVEGGVSEVTRRAIRAAAGGRVGRAENAERPTDAERSKTDSTVLTVFLPDHLADFARGLSGQGLCALLAGYLDLPRPPPPPSFETELAEGRDYVVVSELEQIEEER